MNTRISQFIFPLILAWMVLFPSVVYAGAIVLDEVIAIVNDEALTRSEYQARYKREQIQSDRGGGPIPEKIDPEILRLLIDERIQAHAAQAAKISIDQSEIESMLVNMANQNNLLPKQLLIELESQGISEAHFLRSIEEQALIQRIVDIAVHSWVTISEQEIDYYLKAHKELYPSNQTYEISHLYISTSGKSTAEIESERENVNYIHQMLQQGQPFPKAVEYFSDGENQKEGGYLGWKKEDQLPDLFLTVLRQTLVGDVSEAIKSDNGFHILKLHAKKGSTKMVTQHLVRHILIQPQRHNLTDQEAIKMLTDIADTINHEGRFEKFARLTSDDTTTVSAGGSLGWISPEDTDSLFEQAVFDLPLNQLSDPVKTRFGYHLIEVLEHREKDISWDIARNNAHDELFKRKYEELYQNWFDRLSDSAYIEYLVDN